MISPSDDARPYIDQTLLAFLTTMESLAGGLSYARFCSSDGRLQWDWEVKLQGRRCEYLFISWDSDLLAYCWGCTVGDVDGAEDAPQDSFDLPLGWIPGALARALKAFKALKVQEV